MDTDPARTDGLRRVAMAAPLLTVEQEQELAALAARGDARAVEQLVHAHMRLVYCIADEFRRFGVSKDELVSEGMLALTVAARRFDPSRGARLSSYASRWIRGLLRRFTLQNRRVVHAPSSRNGRRAMANLNRLERRLCQTLGTPPDRQTLARELGVPVAEVEQAQGALYARDLGVATAASHERDTIDLASDEPSAEALVAQLQESRARHALLADALGRLGPRERTIIRARRLLDPPATLGALGDEIGVSSERIRQLEGRGYAQLRAALVESVA